MDRLITLIALRFKLTLRAYLRSRESLFGLLLVLPIMALFSLALAIGVFVVARGLARHDPRMLLSALSAFGTVFGMGWAFSPLLTGAAISEGHDLTRLARFPVSSLWLAGSALFAYSFEPAVWSPMLLTLALAAALSHGIEGFLPSLIGAALTLVFIVIMAQCAALGYEWVARRRKWHDRLLLVGFGLGVALSLAPLALFFGGARLAAGLYRFVVDSDPFVISPFSWGLRAAVHGGRGEILPFLLFGFLAMLACVLGFCASTALVRRMISSTGWSGAEARGRGAERPPRFLPGEAGAVVSKDLRQIWRDPGLKAAMFMSLLAPLILLFWLGRSSTMSAGSMLLLSFFVGIAPLGMNAFGLERRGIQLLMTFPAPRWKILVGKNAAALVMRAPGLVLLLIASFLMAPASMAASALATAAVLLLLSLAADGYLSILFPVTLPSPGRSPHARPAGGRGLGLFVVTSLTVGLVLVTAAPFVLLAWLHLLLETPWIIVVTLPLALIGAVAAYAMLVGGAAHLLSRREDMLLERILGEV
ncbi:MAG: hypothetical protein JXO72_00300 [Vicinamibacteria bacterium]|nr:hypothetical protein [Vicinamibacteria bacterium]